MKIVTIFDIVKGTLYSVQFNDKDEDEWAHLMNCWTDVEFLRTFFKKNEQQILNGEFYKGINVDEAIRRTLRDARIIEETILDLAKNGNSNKTKALQTLFKPLNNNESTIKPHQETKAKLEKGSWLRVYAIRISENFFVISGGGIKLTHKMDESDHLKIELQKLEIVKRYLKDQGVAGEDDYDILELDL